MTDGQFFVLGEAIILLPIACFLWFGWGRVLDAAERRLRLRKRLSPYDWQQDPQMRQPSHVRIVGRPDEP